MKNKKNKIIFKKGTRVCHIHDGWTYGTIIEDIRKGSPAFVRVESEPRGVHRKGCYYISFRPTLLRKMDKEDMLRLAIDKMERAG
jgi:hypothetical protein